MKPLDQIIEDSEEYWNLRPRDKDRWEEMHKPKVLVKHKSGLTRIGLLDRVIERDGVTYWSVHSLCSFSASSGWAGSYLPEECEVISTPTVSQPKLF